jgi:hypothetical protein
MCLQILDALLRARHFMSCGLDVEKRIFIFPTAVISNNWSKSTAVAFVFQKQL